MEYGSSLWIAGIGIVTYLFYKWSTKNHDYFEKRGIPYKKPFLFLGSSPTFWLSKKSIGEFIISLYSEFKGEKITGLFEFRTPFCMILDPEMIKRITVKDFDHFMDHRSFSNKDDHSNELLAKALSVLTGQKWKDMRTTLSPAFTGSKMRQMFVLIADCADRMAKSLRKEAKPLTLDMKNLFSQYTNDVIASTAFGIEVNSLENPDNEFFVMGKNIMTPSKWLMIARLMFMQLAPRLAKLLRIKFISVKVESFFRRLVLDTMRIRDEQNIIRPDMIHLLMQSRKGQLKREVDEIGDTDSVASIKEPPISEGDQMTTSVSQTEWTDDDIVAQCLLFFFAGFETSATLLAFVAHDLATNREVQMKLIAEIDSVTADTDGTLTYSKLQSMKYLDMVISESLRKWPPAPILDRCCVKDYNYIEDGQTKWTMQKGEFLWIPIIGLHYDEKYFPNPYQYDPERFNEVNVKDIVPGSYAPFGMGPRSCIASRFALMSVKTIIVQLLKNFTFERCAKTLYPMRMGKLSLIPDEGIHLEIKPRTVDESDVN